MQINLEIEYKTLLSLGEYDQLAKYFRHLKPIRQTNHYFDSHDLKLRENKLSLRIRTFDNKAEMTLKIPQTVGNLEHNVALTLDEARDILKRKKLPENDTKIQKITNILQNMAINVSDITVLGALTTIRRECQSKIGLMALDKNDYLGKIDYELELEVKDAKTGEIAFDNFLSDNHIEYRYARSKVVRFLEALNKLPYI
ncbi:adenylate cyclase [Lactococcus hodotermopsidis]|uniref:Adenylate cyclase n=1 Tax=Pseudolactococcus hodotermopsidis TaxID=2709157 RepID=A0A6A0BBE4_9LACT|nr:CYTH domain-containing protein [Lactococcus hodotermopsidis]GFH42789.1 adenylate cyclase [Lactococcus hodotermopsidis]